MPEVVESDTRDAAVSRRYSTIVRRPLSAANDGCEKETLTTVSSDGAFVATLGGSRFIVDEVDRVDSMLWLETDDVVICGDGYRVTFIHDGEVAHGHRAR